MILSERRLHALCQRSQTTANHTGGAGGTWSFATINKTRSTVNLSFWPRVQRRRVTKNGLCIPCLPRGKMRLIKAVTSASHMRADCARFNSLACKSCAFHRSACAVVGFGPRFANQVQRGTDASTTTIVVGRASPPKCSANACGRSLDRATGATVRRPLHNRLGKHCTTACATDFRDHCVSKLSDF